MPSGQYTRKSRPIADRFWEKVLVRDGCWGWTGDTNGVGYGSLHIRRRLENYRKNLYAHRISWEIHNGPIPAGLFVCHRCDNPSCCNPAHLFLGTNTDNMRDCSARGRQNGPAKSLPGIKNGNAILDDEKVREIRLSDKRGVDLARQFSVHKSLITAIRKRKAWAHVA
jgi:hypothetical protein